MHHFLSVSPPPRSLDLTWFAGGRFFVIAIFFGLAVSITSTFCVINVYMSETVFFNEKSPFYSPELVHFMRNICIHCIQHVLHRWLSVECLCALPFYVCMLGTLSLAVQGRCFSLVQYSCSPWG
jgi:hypothetical protein